MIRKLILGLMLSSISLGVYAETIECVSLKKNETLEMELKSTERYANCFSLSNAKQNTPVHIVAYSGRNVRNKITLYDLNEGGLSSYIAEYSSDATGVNTVNLNTTNKKLAFKITPTSYLDSNKNLTISFLDVDNIAQVLIDFDNGRKVYTPQNPNPRNSRCSNRHKERGCEEP